nr:hypothetical protein [Acinetobacter sp. ANC 4641]
MNQQRLKQRSVMDTPSEKTAKQKMILAKAILAAAERLGLTQDQLAIMSNYLMKDVTN